MRQAMEEILKVSKMYRNVEIEKLAQEALDVDDIERNKISWTRINNDVNGNPRYVAHYLQCQPFEGASYEEAIYAMRKIGGGKFHNKQYGGGIVFQSYNLDSTEANIKEVQSKGGSK